MKEFLCSCLPVAYLIGQHFGQNRQSLPKRRPQRKPWWLGEKRESDYPIRLLTTRPNFGGARWWFIYLVVILDAYTRAVRGWALSRTIDDDSTLAALEMALNHRTPRIFHSDQGAQYTAW